MNLSVRDNTTVAYVCYVLFFFPFEKKCTGKKPDNYQCNWAEKNILKS